jgi:molybdate transport system substrate-binding protein
MRRCALALLCALACACGSSGSAARPTVVVFAAASLSRALPAAISSFGPSATVQADYEGTQALLAKLEADDTLADVFASADQAHMDEAVRRGLVDTPHRLAANRLVIAVAPGNPRHITGLADLARPGLRLSLADASVPAGKYAEQALHLAESRHDAPAGFAARVLANVATRQTDVETVVSDVALGTVDAGIVYASDARTNPRITAVAIPLTDQPPTLYLVAVTRHAPHHQDAQRFVDFLLSATGQRILHDAGFLPPP